MEGIEFEVVNPENIIEFANFQEAERRRVNRDTMIVVLDRAFNELSTLDCRRNRSDRELKVRQDLHNLLLTQGYKLPSDVVKLLLKPIPLLDDEMSTLKAIITELSDFLEIEGNPREYIEKPTVRIIRADTFKKVKGVLK